MKGPTDMVTLSARSLLPGLVVTFCNEHAIVTRMFRENLNEQVTLDLNAPSGSITIRCPDLLEFQVWGTCWSLSPDEIEFFRIREI